MHYKRLRRSTTMLLTPRLMALGASDYKFGGDVTMLRHPHVHCMQMHLMQLSPK